MLESLLGLFQGSPLALWGFFLILILCGFGLPIPEDIVLLAAGMLGRDDGRSWLQTSALMYLGVITGDTLIFLAGRHFGSRLLAHRWLQRMLPPAKQARIERLFERYGAMGLFLARFLPGLRAPIFCSAGAMKVRLGKFLLLDGAAALISVPAFVWLGDWLWLKFADDFEQLSATLAQTHEYSLWCTLGLIALAVVGGGLWHQFRSRRPS